MDKTLDEIIATKKTRIEAWHSSLEYSQYCNYYQNEINRLYNIGQKYCSHINLESLFRTQIVRIETSIDGGLHRGFYCPSKIIDLVTGNVKRGKISQRASLGGKSYFLYNFNQEGLLVLIENYSRGEKLYTEYLFYDGNYVYGITLGNEGDIKQISEEKYENKKIIHYKIAHFLQGKGLEISCEKYNYDKDGLYCCISHVYYPLPNVYYQTIRLFEREDGYLSGYSTIDAPLNRYPEDEKPQHYKVSIKRQAQ